MTDELLNTVIIGSGPAGCAAGVYTSRANLKPVLITGDNPGGQLVTTPEIENYPGAMGSPSGFDLMEKLQQHAKSLGTEFISDKVVKAELKGPVKTLTLGSGRMLKTRTVIIATGAAPRYLGVPGEDQYKGKGVSACATCDGFFFRGKEVAVVGGGSAAFVEALFLTQMCAKVYLIHRREGFRAEAVLVDKLKAKAAEGKAEFVLNAIVQEVKGDGERLTGLVLKQQGEVKELPVSGVFAAIGHLPQTELFKDEIELDKDGFIVIGKGSAQATSEPGVFAAGDCSDRIYRQAITSAGSGCKAALDAEHFLLA